MLNHDHRDDDSEFSELQKLLRMKRHEQPPAEYFEDFLAEFRQRQRQQLLRTPLRQLITDRVGTFFQQFSLPNYAYATASALVLVAAGITTANILKAPGGLAPVLAEQGTAPTIQLAAASAPLPAESILQLRAEDNFANLRLTPADMRQTRVINAGASPYYTLDARPVNYDRGVQF